MSDQDRSREREHWQAIAEQLGLGPEPESTAAEPAAKRVSAPDPLANRVEPVAKGAFTADLVAEETISTPAEPERLLPHEPAVEPALHDENQAATAQESSEVEPEPRSRRRGRRRRKESPEEEAPADEGRTATAEVDSREEAAEGTGQQTNRRGRRRKVKAAVQSSAAGEESVADQPDKDDDLDDLDDFSQWNVPSWNELIASLYRPGR